jgi:hypothetical protein
MKRIPLTDDQERMRVDRAAKEREDQSAAEDKALDAAVRKSIKLHGA